MFVVVGQSGNSHWNVEAYTSELAALSHAELANRHCQEHGYHRFLRRPAVIKANPFDPQMLVIGGSVHYFVDNKEERPA